MTNSPQTSAIGGDNQTGYSGFSRDVRPDSILSSPFIFAFGFDHSAATLEMNELFLIQNLINFFKPSVFHF